jgi:hypothetical protein
MGAAFGAIRWTPQAGWDSGASRRRLGVALCASAAFHIWLSAAVPGARPARTPTARPLASITALLHSPRPVSSEPVPESGAAPSRAEVHDRGDDPGAPQPTQQEERAMPAAPSASPGARDAGHARAVPAVADATWYTAQDLDAYPRSDAPLTIDRAAFAAAGEAPARLLLWLRIDERGVVVHVSAGEPGMPSRWVDLARRSLAGTRFTPGRKDGRAVRSRLLLSVNPAGGG